MHHVYNWLGALVALCKPFECVHISHKLLDGVCHPASKLRQKDQDEHNLHARRKSILRMIYQNQKYLHDERRVSASQLLEG